MSPALAGNFFTIAPHLSLSVIYLSMWVCAKLSDSVTFWTIVHRAPLCMGFSMQEYWSGLSFPAPGPRDQTQISCASGTAGEFFTAWAIREGLIYVCIYHLSKVSYMFSLSETYITATTLSEPKIRTLFFDNRELLEISVTEYLKSRPTQRT